MKKVISVLLVIIWMIFIFVMSSSSSNQSNNQSGFFVDIIVNIFNISNVDMVTLVVRKMAHLAEYFILGILLSNMFKCFDKKIYISVIMCILYAISDEIHQLYVPGRSGQFVDVVIDSVGGIFGYSIFMYWNYIVRRGSKDLFFERKSL